MDKKNNSGISGSLEVLIADFQMKLDRVETGFQILDVVQHSSEGVLTLRELRDNVYELQALNKAIRNCLNSAKEDFDALKEKKERLSKVRCLINQIYCKLPEPVFAEQPVPTPRNEKAMTDIKNELEGVDKENKKPRKTNEKSKCLKILRHEDFSKLPKHVKGHFNLEQINGGIHEINTILSKKYEFLKRPAKSLSLNDKKKRSRILEMGKDLKGTEFEVFFMDDDIQCYGTIMKMKPRRRDGVFLVLRHLGKLKEIKRGKPSRYCILGG